MKKYNTLLSAVLFLLIMVLAGCSDDPSPGGPEDPKIPENNVQNINKNEVPDSSEGGDPRGTYFANKPFYFLNSPSYTDSTASNEANLMYKFEGSSSSEGSFVYLEGSVNVDITIISFVNSSRQRFTLNSSSNPVKEIRGTWRAAGDTLVTIVNGVETAYRYTANNKGLFIFTNISLFTNVPAIRAYKKQ